MRRIVRWQASVAAELVVFVAQTMAAWGIALAILALGVWGIQRVLEAVAPMG